MPSVRLVAWRGCAKGDVVGVAAIKLVEIELVIEDVVIERRDARLRVVLPRGVPAVLDERESEALRPVLRAGRRKSPGGLRARLWLR